MKKVKNKLQVRHYAQVPCEPFCVDVSDEVEAKKIKDVLADQHLFLFEQKIIPDYANSICVVMWDENSDGEGHPDCTGTRRKIWIGMNLKKNIVKKKKKETNFMAIKNIAFAKKLWHEIKALEQKYKRNNEAINQLILSNMDISFEIQKRLDKFDEDKDREIITPSMPEIPEDLPF